MRHHSLVYRHEEVFRKVPFSGNGLTVIQKVAVYLLKSCSVLRGDVSVTVLNWLIAPFDNVGEPL
jgi:hypothetical protein